MRKLYSLLIYVTGTACMPACDDKSFEDKVQLLYKNTVPLIHSEEFKNLSRDGLFVLDARSAGEYQVSHIENARFVGYKTFAEESIQDIPKDANIVVYCSVGYRSERIGERMQKLGYTNVLNLYGGIFDWKNNGNEVINFYNQPTDSVHAYNRIWGQLLYNGIKVYE